MKIFTFLVAAAQASPNRAGQRVLDNWWTTIDETFNFAINDRTTFTETVDAVSQNCWPKLGCPRN